MSKIHCEAWLVRGSAGKVEVSVLVQTHYVEGQEQGVKLQRRKANVSMKTYMCLAVCFTKLNTYLGSLPFCSGMD